jgi:SAM-dependent methyltransferase
MRDERVEITGIDVSRKAIAFAKVFNPTKKFYVADIANWNPPKKFDQAVLIEVLEHIPPKLVDRVLSNISASLKRGGKLIVTVPSKKLRPWKWWRHFQHFSEQTLKRTLGRYFLVEKIYGHSKTGLKKILFDFLRIFGCVICLPSGGIKFLKNYFAFLENYFKLHLENCTPREGERLIAICRKSLPSGSHRRWRKSARVKIDEAKSLFR